MGRRSHDDEELVPLPVVPRPGATPAWGPDGMAPDPSGPRSSWLARAVVVGALLGGLVVAGALVSRRGSGGREATGGQVVREDFRPASGDEPAPEGWRRGVPGPLHHREFAVQVWTGSELLVWGGDPDGDSGAAYDPATDRWRVLPIGPISASSVTLSAWTGTEWVLANPGGPAAAFDPVANRWRTLEPVPRRFSAIVGQWTGREVMVFGTEVTEKGPSTVGAAYRHWAAAFDPSLNRWRTLPEPPLELAATAVWDGRRLVAWDMNLGSAALDPDGDSGWERLPDVPVDFADCSPQGARLGEAIFAAECGRGALFRPWTGEWERIPHPRMLAEKPVWTGRDALFWVGRFAGSADGIWLYRPQGAQRTDGPD